MFAKDDNGYMLTPSNKDGNDAYMIDRSPCYFEVILNYLRHSQLILDPGINPEGMLYLAMMNVLY